MRRMIWKQRRRITAALLNYYWLPCPVCGEEFSGRDERKDGRSLAVWGAPYHFRVGRDVCPWCPGQEVPGGEFVEGEPHPFPGGGGGQR